MTSVSWTQRGNHLAVGTNKGEVAGDRKRGRGNSHQPQRGGTTWTRWWFQIRYFFYFHPIPGEDSHFDSYFSDGLKPPTSGGSGCGPNPGNQSGFTGVKNSRRITGVVGHVT